MKIYTKKGDAGQTGLYGGERVSKDHLRIQSYGTLDELNAVLGLVISQTSQSFPDAAGAEAGSPLAWKNLILGLQRIQGELFQLGAELATPRGKETGIATLAGAEIERLEQEIDEMEAVLPPLKTFILPGGALSSAQLHLARTVSRRAERELITLHRAEPTRPEVLQYLNRLSDFLFVCARYANHLAKFPDIPWLPEKSEKKKISFE